MPQQIRIIRLGQLQAVGVVVDDCVPVGNAFGGGGDANMLSGQTVAPCRTGPKRRNPMQVRQLVCVEQFLQLAGHARDAFGQDGRFIGEA